MDVTQKGILTLLKSASMGTAFALPDGFDLEAAYPMVKSHHMVTALYEGAVLCGISRKTPVMQQMFRSYCKALLVSEGQLRELSRVFAAFEENGIDYMPIKGCKLKALYPRPELRLMGDAGVLIRLEQYEKIIPIMESLGFSAKVDSDHEFVWEKNSLYLELHKRLIPSYNVDFYRYYGEGWRLAKCADGNRYSMSPEDEMVFLFTHFAKHYRDGGIGCRHVQDLWMYRRANPELDEDYIRAELEKLRLLEFYENILQLIAVWFADAPEDPKSDFITEYIFDIGSWGKMKTHTVSMGVRDRCQPKGSKNSKLSYLRRVAFPKAEDLRNKYKVLKKTPWMLPLVWAYRSFYKVIWERGSLKKHREKLNLLTPEELDNRQKALNYVGLNYHF